MKKFYKAMFYIFILAVSFLLLFKINQLNKKFRKIELATNQLQDALQKSDRFLVALIQNLQINTAEQQILDKLTTLLKIYSVQDDNGPLKFIRLGRDNDGGYVVPEKALEAADA
jgi:hypothetical protein